ncbi:MAG: UDP-4-keto-6-deoxy-N-acetylglucosamine 4-aminotransferase, partial [Parcubacteria group bacterium Gr01-1014_66]
MIPYSHQAIGSDDIRAVARILASDWLTQGPTIEHFERELAGKVGARYAVAFSSGTAALHGSYAAAGIGPMDEIITSPLTFAATANIALWQGAIPIFADIDEITGTLDPVEAEKKITKKTKAIVVVDYAGLPADLDALR